MYHAFNNNPNKFCLVGDSKVYSNLKKKMKIRRFGRHVACFHLVFAENKENDHVMRYI